MIHWWEQVTFIHWRFDPEVVQRLLPSGLTVETFDGSAWVGLVPFYMRVALPRSRSVPWLSRFAETNVRTYVRSADGTSGVWFLARCGATRAFHDPWPLHRAEILDLDDTLVTATGLPQPVGTPLVHYAPSVEVRIGWPSRVVGQ